MINYLRAHGAQATDGTTDATAFRQGYGGGTNIIAVYPGTELADEIILVGAHYDHLAGCSDQGGSSVCNGATDNAAGVAIALEIAASIHDSGVAPRRTVMFGFWDQEEAGLLGSAGWIADNPTVVSDIVTYVNYDIQGANLLPTLANSAVAVGAESGGAALADAVSAAGGASPLDLSLLSLIFGQGRSDHANFFSDSTGPCYHTTLDTATDALDGPKLDRQRGIGIDLVGQLADGTTTPVFDGGNPPATYADATVIHGLIETSLPDLDRFTPGEQATLLGHEATLEAIVDDGEAAFDSADQTTLLLATIDLVNILTSGTCESFIS